jgi:hypothetical protein
MVAARRVACRPRSVQKCSTSTRPITAALNDSRTRMPRWRRLFRCSGLRSSTAFEPFPYTRIPRRAFSCSRSDRLCLVVPLLSAERDGRTGHVMRLSSGGKRVAKIVALETASRPPGRGSPSTRRLAAQSGATRVVDEAADPLGRQLSLQALGLEPVPDGSGDG